MITLIPTVSLVISGFVSYLQNNLIPPNMELKTYSYQVSNMNFSIAELRAAVSIEVRNICLTTRYLAIQKDCYDAEKYLASNATIKKYWGSGAVTNFSNWLAFDSNWITQEKAFQASKDFISNTVVYNFIKFDTIPVLTDPVSPKGLPIIVDPVNNEITFFTVELRD